MLFVALFCIYPSPSQQKLVVSPIFNRSAFFTRHSHIPLNNCLARTIFCCFLHSSCAYVSGSYFVEDATNEDRGGSFRVCTPDERRANMLRACNVSSHIDSSYRNITKDVLENIFVDDRHKVLGCFVAKVACSTWKYILINATGKVHNVSPDKIPVHSRPYMRTLWLHVLSDYTSEEIEFRLRNYDKFIVVRHPFDRLSSAYREKFGPKNKVYHKMIGKHIIRKYRKQASNESLNTGNDVQFGEFVKFLLDKDPTKYNAHWKRFYEVCDPCRVKYDHIARLETMSHDAKIIFPKLGLSAESKMPKRNINLQKTAYDISEGNNLSYLFNGLPPNDVERLVRIYDLDFRLFGYKWDRMLTSAQCHTSVGGDTCC